MQTIAIAADHGGFELKEQLKNYLGSFSDVQILDLGAKEYNAWDDYPDFAVLAAQSIVGKQAVKAILVCGSGVGACVTANKFKGVRACVCHDTYSAHQGVEHDDMNVLCLGGRIIGIEVAK
ncbi:MAG: RpiB/LacA/LacB family sugar-phosphate isomerase, partial [Chloroflexi bacterium]|nr:RpiB/LacA/LacB family sugar-phosphate isomerase [Chloroflexota bacterium]